MLKRYKGGEDMGVYSDYLDKQFSFEELSNERKKQLQRISNIRNRDIIVYASNINANAPNSIDYSDILPFSDQLSNLKSEDIDIILETPGGLAEVVEDLVKLVRKKHKNIGIIVPGTAKSAGTIFAMAADEILMGDLSSLGPIDAQIVSGGKRFSADAFLEGLNKIRKEASDKKALELAYIPMLQNLSPGEIQHCENAQKFSKTLVTNWLKEYKFKNWNIHETSQTPVTESDKAERADEIASLLCNHGRWLTHGRSIKLRDLQEMKLAITDYSQNAELNDAITRYYTLLQMSFETNIYKIYETPYSQIYRSINQTPPVDNNVLQKLPNPLIANFECGKCKSVFKIQINFEKHFPAMDGTIPFPNNNKFKCPSCGAESDMLGLRQQLEAQTKKKIVS